MGDLYTTEDLLSFATSLLEHAGLPSDRARIVAEVLLEGDLMGHSTHGLQLLAPYLKELDTNTMSKSGDPTVINDRNSALAWNGHYLPGPWLVVQALDVAFERVKVHPVVTLTIQRCHHIASLVAYLKMATDRGLMLVLAASDPDTQTVAPFGGIQPLYSPNPLAVGIPSDDEPILIDISMSSTANGLVGRFRQEGKRLPHPWLLDHQGNLGKS
jgi:L-lactate dehydrogenase